MEENAVATVTEVTGMQEINANNLSDIGIYPA